MSAMATPASPKPPLLESGEIIKKGTAVVMALMSWPPVVVCALRCCVPMAVNNAAQAKAVKNTLILIIFYFCSWVLGRGVPITFNSKILTKVDNYPIGLNLWAKLALLATRSIIVLQFFWAQATAEPFYSKDAHLLFVAVGNFLDTVQVHHWPVTTDVSTIHRSTAIPPKPSPKTNAGPTQRSAQRL